jgi:hypothetical protein
MFGRRTPSFGQSAADSLARGAARDLVDMKSGQRVPIDVVIQEIYEALDFIGYVDPPPSAANGSSETDSDVIAMD